MKDTGALSAALATALAAVELQDAGILIVLDDDETYSRKVHVTGRLHGWEFRRSWGVWDASSNQKLPAKYAVRLSVHYETEICLSGDAEEGCDSYRVKTQRGLNALAEAIRLSNKELK